MEVAANLDPDDPGAVLWLAGLKLKSKANGDGSTAVTYRQRRRTVSAQQYEALSGGLAVVQKVADQVAEGGGNVRLPAEEARLFRHLARADRERPDEAPRDRRPLIEVHDRLKVAVGRLVLEAGSGGTRELRGSSLRGIDERNDPDFAENWILARAAALLTSICRGPGHARLSNARVGVCKTYYVEGERRGPAATRCPDCRRLRPVYRLVKQRHGQLGCLYRKRSSALSAPGSTCRTKVARSKCGHRTRSSIVVTG